MNHFYLNQFLHRLAVGLVTGLLLLAFSACGDEREIPVVIDIEVFPAQLDANPADPPPPGWQRVQAICDFVHAHIAFGYEYARVTRTASEAYEEGVGVCRDFTHLAVAFCRALNIPARYCTGYISEAGQPQPHPPGDFAAWFDVFLDGHWHTFDARNNVPRIGRVLMARGRDAADVAIAMTFGTNTLQSFRVWADETAEPR